MNTNEQTKPTSSNHVKDKAFFYALAVIVFASALIAESSVVLYGVSI